MDYMFYNNDVCANYSMLMPSVYISTFAYYNNRFYKYAKRANFTFVWPLVAYCRKER